MRLLIPLLLSIAPIHADESDLLKICLYQHPQRLVSGIAPTGAVGINAEWEKAGTGQWFIEQQRYGASLIEAGVATASDDLIATGIRMIDWGFARQSPDGNFPGTGDPLHSTSFFVDAAARSALLLKSSTVPSRREKANAWAPKILAAARWMALPEIADKGRANNLLPYTHRFYLCASALGHAAAVTGDEALAKAALAYANQAVTLQQADGTNPEKGGFDVSYQFVGVLYALRYHDVCSDVKTKATILVMAAKALDRALVEANPDGTLSTKGSSRTPLEKSRGGKPKTVDAKSALQALVLASAILSDPHYENAAIRLAEGLKWK